MSGDWRDRDQRWPSAAHWSQTRTEDAKDLLRSPRWSEAHSLRLDEHRPIKLVEEAVRRMLPKTRLGRVMLSNLKVYEQHPHQAQQPVASAH